MITSEFIKAGKAIFTVANLNKETHFTFKITKKVIDDINDDKKDIYFTSVLNGPDNWSNYQYVGIYNPDQNKVFLTKKSPYNLASVEYKVLTWALNIIESQKPLPAGYAIKHSGKCGRCGRLLTTPESIENGIGPECIKRVDGGANKYKKKIKKIKMINKIIKKAGELK